MSQLESMSNESFPSDTHITKIQATSLDQFVQILEISFIFLLTYSLILLLDAAVEGLHLYEPLSSLFLGEPFVGPLYGGQFEAIVRVTLVFNALLFGFSLIFGVWIRRTRDRWDWAKLGYTLRTPGYNFESLIRRGIVLGLLVLAIYYTVMTLTTFLYTRGDFNQALLIHTFSYEGTLLKGAQLLPEIYFWTVEMAFIWPLSAGFFFFSYCHNSLRARFPLGVANILATLFYVFYLAFFFVIPEKGKLQQLAMRIGDPFFWAWSFVFLIALYISFSAFAETGSLAVPFLLNFVLNIGLLVVNVINSSIYYEPTPLMLIPYFIILLVLFVWFLVKRVDFSTIKLGIKHLTDIKIKNIYAIAGAVLLFITLAFLIPGVLELLLFGTETPNLVLITLTYALVYASIIFLAIIVLTYEPTRVYDVLLLNKTAGVPIATHIELFQSDEVLISGFFTAISNVSGELDAESSEVRSIKRGEREIIIEEGVLTRIIALVDKDQPLIRRSIAEMQKQFEIKVDAEKVERWTGQKIPEAKELVASVGRLSIRFNIPQQTQWLLVLTLVLTPLIITLIGLYASVFRVV